MRSKGWFGFLLSVLGIEPKVSHIKHDCVTVVLRQELSMKSWLP